MILVAILLPPVAVLACGKPFQALINCLLTLFFWFPGMIHAIIVVNSYNADKRHKEALAFHQRSTDALIAAQQKPQVIELNVDGQALADAASKVPPSKLTPGKLQ